MRWARPARRARRAHRRMARRVERDSRWRRTRLPARPLARPRASQCAPPRSIPVRRPPRGPSRRLAHPPLGCPLALSMLRTASHRRHAVVTHPALPRLRVPSSYRRMPAQHWQRPTRSPTQLPHGYPWVLSRATSPPSPPTARPSLPPRIVTRGASEGSALHRLMRRPRRRRRRAEPRQSCPLPPPPPAASVLACRHRGASLRRVQQRAGRRWLMAARLASHPQRARRQRQRRRLPAYWRPRRRHARYRGSRRRSRDSRHRSHRSRSRRHQQGHNRVAICRRRGPRLREMWRRRQCRRCRLWSKLPPLAIAATPHWLSARPRTAPAPPPIPTRTSAPPRRRPLRHQAARPPPPSRRRRRAAAAPRYDSPSRRWSLRMPPAAAWALCSGPHPHGER